MPDELKIAPDPDRGIVPAICIAGLVLITVAIVVFLVNPRETAAIVVDNVQTFAPHTEFTSAPGTMSVLGEAAPGEDNLYVVAKVRVTDKLRLPLFINDTTVALTGANGAATVATSISPRYFDRLEKIFPALTPLLQGQSLRDGDEIEPGETREGKILLLFPGLKQSDWAAKKSAVLSLNLRNQTPQTAKLP